jgi:hypothetical protein
MISHVGGDGKIEKKRKKFRKKRKQDRQRRTSKSGRERSAAEIRAA